MSFKINGETWQPQSASEHAAAIIGQLNQLLQQNEVKDQSGNIVQLKQTYGNALYLVALGDANRFAINDEKLTRAINSFNIELCDDQQIENLLPIAAVTRNPGSYSTLDLVCTASDDGECIIPAGTKAKYGDVNFVVQNDVVISAGSSQTIRTQADVLGPIAVLTGEVTSFDAPVANLESVENLESSIPGVPPETTSELRQRLILGDTIKYSLNGCKNALEELTGITHARVYFNFNTQTDIELPGGVTVAPRTAYIVVRGSSDQLAEVYSEYMSAPTQNSPIGAGTYSYVDITIAAATAGNAIIPQGSSVTYQGHVYKTSAQVTITAGTTQVVRFTCTEWGENHIPAFAITELDQTISNVESVINNTAAVPGTDDPKRSQDWVTDSGQVIPIKYDTANEQNVFVRVWLKSEAESGSQVDNQIKRDLILASSEWAIGESVTQINTCAPFVDCTYTQVAFTEISLDGETWGQFQDVGCNVIPRVTDGTITIEQLGD